MLKLKPPTHRVDAVGIFIAPHDPAWDDARYTSEMAVIDARTLVTVQDAAEAEARALGCSDTDALEVRAKARPSMEQLQAARGLHPVVRYAAGRTRYQLDAPDWDHDHKPCTVREYLRSAPTEFAIRRPSYTEYQAAVDIVDTRARLLAFLRAGLVAVRSEGWNWERAGAVPEDVIEALHACDPSLPYEVGQAVTLLCRRLDLAEDFR